MSAEVAATAAPPATELDKNAQAAEEAKKMLAELQGASGSSRTEKTNGNVQKSETNGEDGKAIEESEEKTEDQTEGKKEAKTGEVEAERSDERRQRNEGRSSRGGRGGFQQRNYRENIKSDLTTQKESSDPAAIRKQVEFYFSDSNLPMDKFLLSKVGGSQNHPVELSIIHSFKRMRHFQPFEAIVEAMKESTILELTDDDTCVKRREPLPEALNNGPDPNAIRVFEDRAQPRSVYAKGFGEEQSSTHFDIEAFFAQYGPTNAIRLRRSDSKIFKGSVFVEFATEELQQAFLALDPKPQFQGKDLQIMSKKEYCESKVEDIKSGKVRPNDGSRFTRGRGDRSYGGRDKRKRDDEDDRDWRDRRDSDRKNGFRDDRRGGGRRRGSPDYEAGGRGHRGHKDHKNEKNETDHRGVPVVKVSEESPAESKAKREAATADALAKAKAMVAAEQTKSTEAHSADNGNGAVKSEDKKRAREEDDDATGPELKKIDTKPDTKEEAIGQS